jgi:hypothetical protein
VAVQHKLRSLGATEQPIDTGVFAEFETPDSKTIDANTKKPTSARSRLNSPP